MKKVVLFSLLFTSLLFSCKKDKDAKDSNPIINRWKVEKKDEKWGTSGTTTTKIVETEWVEFKENGVFVEQLAPGVQTHSKWKLLENGNLDVSASIDIPSGSGGLIIKSISNNAMHLYWQGMTSYGFGTPVQLTQNVYLIKL